MAILSEPVPHTAVRADASGWRVYSASADQRIRAIVMPWRFTAPNGEFGPLDLLLETEEGERLGMGSLAFRMLYRPTPLAELR